MKEEVDKAVNYFSNFLTNSLVKMDTPCNNKKNQLMEKIDKFKIALDKLLKIYYHDHWFPTNPNKGSGYRCIRINHKLDPIISKAGTQCGFTEELLKSIFPSELTMWIDPNEVSARIGENGSICQIYKNHPPVHQLRKPSPSLSINMNCKRIKAHSDSSESNSDGCSPMSISPPTCMPPPTPVLKITTCNDEFRRKNPDFPIEYGNLPLACQVNC